MFIDQNYLYGLLTTGGEIDPMTAPDFERSMKPISKDLRQSDLSLNQAQFDEVIAQSAKTIGKIKKEPFFVYESETGEPIDVESIVHRHYALIILYFGSRDVPASAKFTPALEVAFEEAIQSNSQSALLLYIGHENSLETFRKEVNSRQYWLVYAYASTVAKRLARKFNVTSVPTVVVLDGITGEVKTKNGVEHVLHNGAESFVFSEVERSVAEAQDLGQDVRVKSPFKPK